MDFQPFPISPRTQLEGIIHLLTSTNTTHAIIGGSANLVELQDKLIVSVARKGHPALNRIAPPALIDLFPELSNSEKSKSQHVEFKPFLDVEPTTEDSTVVVLHSSGSTGLPRPVSFHQKGVLCSIVNQREYCKLHWPLSPNDQVL